MQGVAMPLTNIRKLLEEKLLTLTEAAKIAPGRPHTASLTRWCKKGIRGVRLESLVCAGRRMTSREAVMRFVLATTTAADGIVDEDNVVAMVPTDVEKLLDHEGL